MAMRVTTEQLSVVGESSAQLEGIEAPCFHELGPRAIVASVRLIAALLPRSADIEKVVVRESPFV